MKLSLGISPTICTTLLFGVCAFTATRVAGETEFGNGGDAIVCIQDGVQEAEVYDAYEARVLLGLPSSFGPSQDPQEMAQFAVMRLKDLDPVRFRRLTRLIDSFMQEARIIPRANLTDIPDTDPSVVPLGCELRQLAIQYRNPAPRMPRYLVDKDLWDILSPESKAYLILHEVIYYETIRRGAQDSKTARYFNAHLASEFFNDIQQSDYDDLVKNELSLPTLVEADGITLDKDSVVRNSSGTLIMGRFAGHEYTPTDLDSRTWRKGSREILIDHDANIYFTRDGKLWKSSGTVVTKNNRVEVSRVPVLVESTDQFYFRLPYKGTSFELMEDSKVFFPVLSTLGVMYGNPNACFGLLATYDTNGFTIDQYGMPSGKVFASWQTARIKVGTVAECASGAGRAVFYQSHEPYAFYPNGHLKSAKLSHNARLLDQAGNEVELAPETVIILDENGRLLP